MSHNRFKTATSSTNATSKTINVKFTCRLGGRRGRGKERTGKNKKKRGRK